MPIISTIVDSFQWASPLRQKMACMNKFVIFVKRIAGAVKEMLFPDIDDETKDALQNLELKEDGYLYLGIY